MFKAVISRDDGEPWPTTDMTSTKWLAIPVGTVRIADLTATQPGILLHALAGDPEPIGGDPVPHVIDWAGEHYLEDGHHRVIRALIAGQHSITARILTVT